MKSISIWYANVKTINVAGCILDPEIVFGILEEPRDVRRT
jgi:hypothetical protein